MFTETQTKARLFYAKHKETARNVTLVVASSAVVATVATKLTQHRQTLVDAHLMHNTRDNSDFLLTRKRNGEWGYYPWQMDDTSGLPED